MSIGGGMRFRADGRARGQLRPVSIELDVQKWVAASLVYRQGDTHVLVSATVEDRIPPHLRGKGTGWITAEYSMLPGATSERSQRESVRGRVGGRTHEIQRLIGRALRGVVDTAVLGERTVTLDCDVLQADGGTRCASITGSFVALSLALRRIGLERAVRNRIAAVSVGIVDGTPLLDLEYTEDSRAEVDFNVVGTDAGTYVEVQGTAEGKPFDRAQMVRLLDLADEGMRRLFEIQDEAIERGSSLRRPAGSPGSR
ncbi:ribonuclease PH [soil metagenome]